METERNGTDTREDGDSDAARELWRIQDEQPSDFDKAYRALRERVKELNGLYGVARLVERHGDSLEDLLSALVDFLPLSWQWPELTCARIDFEGRTYKGKDFREGRWRQAAAIVVGDRRAGEIEIFLKGVPPIGAGSAFLEEEAVMLEEIATRIGSAALRLETRRQLAVERRALQEANAALRNLLARIEEEKLRIGRDVRGNIERVVLPVLDALSLELPPEKRKYAEILRMSLEDVTSPFAARLSQERSLLTPVETTVCNLIRSGLGTKEIAELRGVSPSTVLRQRERIRQKLNLRNQKANLATFLRSTE